MHLSSLTFAFDSLNSSEPKAQQQQQQLRSGLDHGGLDSGQSYAPDSGLDHGGIISGKSYVPGLDHGGFDSGESKAEIVFFIEE